MADNGTTIYVLTAGSYSDYHIIGVFDDRDRAEEYEDLYTDTQIEEYKLNDVPRGGVPAGMYAWYVRVEKGGVDRAHKHDPVKAQARFLSDSKGNWSIYGFVHARSQEHAFEIANEKRAALIAAGRWPDHIPDYSIGNHRVPIEDW